MNSGGEYCRRLLVVGKFPAGAELKPFIRGRVSIGTSGACMLRTGETDGFRVAEAELACRELIPFGKRACLCSSEVLGRRPGLACETQANVSVSRCTGRKSRSQVCITVSMGGGGDGKFCSEQ